MVTFFFMVSSIPPLTATGLAAPRFVPGAMAATWAAIVMKVPAEAALAPPGATYTATGTDEEIIALMMMRMEVSSPPGVSNCRTINSAPRVFASAIPLTMYSAVAGLMTPSTFRTRTVRPSGSLAVSEPERAGRRMAAQRESGRMRFRRSDRLPAMPCLESTSKSVGQPLMKI